MIISEIITCFNNNKINLIAVHQLLIIFLYNMNCISNSTNINTSTNNDIEGKVKVIIIN